MGAAGSLYASVPAEVVPPGASQVPRGTTYTPSAALAALPQRTARRAAEYRSASAPPAHQPPASPATAPRPISLRIQLPASGRLTPRPGWRLAIRDCSYAHREQGNPRASDTVLARKKKKICFYEIKNFSVRFEISLGGALPARASDERIVSLQPRHGGTGGSGEGGGAKTYFQPDDCNYNYARLIRGAH